jgi:hypothetical protein
MVVNVVWLFLGLAVFFVIATTAIAFSGFAVFSRLRSVARRSRH